LFDGAVLPSLLEYPGAVVEVKLPWAVCMSIIKSTCEDSKVHDFESSFSVEDSVFILSLRQFGTGFERSSIFITVLEGIHAFVIAHLVSLPHADIFVSIREDHLSIARSLTIEQLTFVNVSLVVLQDAV